MCIKTKPTYLYLHIQVHVDEVAAAANGLRTKNIPALFAIRPPCGSEQATQQHFPCMV